MESCKVIYSIRTEDREVLYRDIPHKELGIKIERTVPDLSHLEKSLIDSGFSCSSTDDLQRGKQDFILIYDYVGRGLVGMIQQGDRTEIRGYAKFEMIVVKDACNLVEFAENYNPVPLKQ